MVEESVRHATSAKLLLKTNISILQQLSNNLLFYRDCCRVKRYAAPIYGKVLQGHVFKTLQLEKEEMCRINCYLEEKCQSYNLASSPHVGRWECQLSNTDDKQHPESLVSWPGNIYRAT